MDSRTVMVSTVPATERGAHKTQHGALIDLASQLVEIDTTNPPGGELAAARCVARFLDAHGVEVQLQDLGSGRANLVARVRGAGRDPGIMLSGHLDTVPVGPGSWSVPALGGVVRGDCLYGRGAVDMKGAVAAMAVALGNIASWPVPPAVDVVLALTAGEETDSFGAAALTESKLLGEIGAAVVGEPTGMTVGFAHRGALWVRIEVEGRGAHGSQPSLGTNAVRRLLDWLHPLASIEALVAEQTDDVLGRGTASLIVFSGGEAANVIPGRAFAIIDFRTLPEHDHEELLQALRARGNSVKLSVLRDSPAMMTPPDHPFVTGVAAAVESVTGCPAVLRSLPYTSDASVFSARLGIPIVMVGPGSEASAHTEDESVELSALQVAAQVYERIVATTTPTAPRARPESGDQ